MKRLKIEMTIRTRLLLFAGLLLMLLAASNLYLRSQITTAQQALEAGATTLNAVSQTLQAGRQTLLSISRDLQAGTQTIAEDVEIVGKLEIINRTLRNFGEMKFWLTDLEVSWLNESEENAEAARAALEVDIYQLEVVVEPAPTFVTL